MKGGERNGMAWGGAEAKKNEKRNMTYPRTVLQPKASTAHSQPHPPQHPPSQHPHHPDSPSPSPLPSSHPPVPQPPTPPQTAHKSPKSPTHAPPPYENNALRLELGGERGGDYLGSGRLGIGIVLGLVWGWGGVG